ncbi:hypothetical protein FRX31_016354 [Thalictrum thalictroides]|uniref:HMA domain-containing protein n=1 Tax=Thalictrum thalictroides TaxID=46969 RepID=A0A7J6WAZ9_THATH|nr:hypothetical protein FRX31_016354 [Thalictrum thalictroides]
MKQKVVIKIFSMNDTRSRKKALQIAVSFPGVASVELQGDENQIAITGEGIDSTCLTQKVVIKIFSMNDTRSRKKALQIAVSFPGVASVELQGDENQIAITGEGIDSTCLTVKIRKKVGYTEIVSVTPIPAEKKPEEKKPDEKKPTVEPIFYHPNQYGTPPIYCYGMPIRDPNPDLCTIM